MRVATDLTSLQLPNEIRWHFIGTLQSNKAKNLAGRSSPLSKFYSTLTFGSHTESPHNPNTYIRQSGHCTE